jgi:predicted permease
MQDLRYALRTLRKQPIVTLVAVLTLALGIGANTAIFSLLYQVLLRPLPYPAAERLVFIWNSYPKTGSRPSDVSIPDYLDRRAEASAIEDAALFRVRDMTLTEGDRPEQFRALAVTPSFFSTLGRGPALGRAFTAADATVNADRFVVLTHALWLSHFGADPSLVGRDVRLDGEPYTVAGVLPADFELPSPHVALLVPFSFTPAQMSDRERGNEFSVMIARLRPGASIEELNGQMYTIVTRLIDRLPARAAFMRNSGFTGIAIGLRDQLVGDVRTWLYLLQAGVIVVLLIACANVANLLLIRATGRHREFAIRAALGAGTWRLTRQLLAEGAMLSLCGAGAALIVAAGGVRGLVALTAEQLPGIASTGLQPAVLAFAFVIAAGTTIVFGLAPAISVFRRDTMSALRDDATRASAGSHTGTMRVALVVAETALAVVLLVSAGLLLKSFTRLVRVDPGFSPDHILTAKVSLSPTRYRGADAQRAFWRRFLGNAREMPGTTAVGLVSSVPFSGSVSSGTYQVTGHPYAPAEKLPHARQDMIDGDYFRAMQIPLLDGRLFDGSDRADSPPVLVVDQFLARRQFPNDTAVGKQLNFGDATNYTIVGVVRTINDSDLSQPVPEERIYYDATQFPLSRMWLVVRTALEPAAVVAQTRAAVQSIDPEQALAEVRTMDQWMAQSVSGRRTPMLLLTLFGLVALVLAALGIYGVVAFSVAQRIREFGIRQALGADRRSILSLVLVHGLRTAAAGVMAGLAASTALTRYLQSMLFGVQAYDAAVFGAATGLLLGVAALACYVPAARATRTDPMVALRDA